MVHSTFARGKSGFGQRLRWVERKK